MSQGCSYSRQGYLSQREWCFALAVFCTLRKLPIEDAKPFLKDHLYTELGKASKYLARNAALLEKLQKI